MVWQKLKTYRYVCEARRVVTQLVAPLGSRASDSMGRMRKKWSERDRARYLAISSSATPTVAPAADRPTVLSAPLALRSLASLILYSLERISDTTSTSPL